MNTKKVAIIALQRNHDTELLISPPNTSFHSIDHIWHRSVWPKTTSAANKNNTKHLRAHVWSENLDPARFLLSSDVFKAEGHSLLVCVPALHLSPVKGDHLVLHRTQSIFMNRNLNSHNGNNKNTGNDPTKLKQDRTNYHFLGVARDCEIFPPVPEINIIVSFSVF